MYGQLISGYQKKKKIKMVHVTSGKNGATTFSITTSDLRTISITVSSVIMLNIMSSVAFFIVLVSVVMVSDVAQKRGSNKREKVTK